MVSHTISLKEKQNIKEWIDPSKSNDSFFLSPCVLFISICFFLRIVTLCASFTLGDHSLINENKWNAYDHTLPKTLHNYYQTQCSFFFISTYNEWLQTISCQTLTPLVFLWNLFFGCIEIWEMIGVKRYYV